MGGDGGVGVLMGVRLGNSPTPINPQLNLMNYPAFGLETRQHRIDSTSHPQQHNTAAVAEAAAACGDAVSAGGSGFRSAFGLRGPGPLVGTGEGDTYRSAFGLRGVSPAQTGDSVACGGEGGATCRSAFGLRGVAPACDGGGESNMGVVEFRSSALLARGSPTTTAEDRARQEYRSSALLARGSRQALAVDTHFGSTSSAARPDDSLTGRRAGDHAPSGTPTSNIAVLPLQNRGECWTNFQKTRPARPAAPGPQAGKCRAKFPKLHGACEIPQKTGGNAGQISQNQFSAVLVDKMPRILINNPAVSKIWSPKHFDGLRPVTARENRPENQPQECTKSDQSKIHEQ